MVTFTLWAEVVKLLATSSHQDPATFAYIQSIYAALERGASAAVMQAFPGLTPIALPAYTPSITFSSIDPWWISGYFTLYCSFRLSIEGGGWGESVYNKFPHVFSVSFNIAELALIEIISYRLGISHYVRSNGERVDLIAKTATEAHFITAFLDQYPLQSYKHEQYLVWRKLSNARVSEL